MSFSNGEKTSPSFMTTKSTISFKFIIVGGSVAGLSAAYALSEAGHRVVVLEKRKQGLKIPGSLRCPPNMTRVLQAIPGVDALFQKSSAKCEQFTFKHGGSMDTIGCMVFHQEIMEDFQADYYVIQYQNLIDLLEKRCTENNVSIHYGSTVNDIEKSCKGVQVACSDGRIEIGDIAVAADGRSSVFRETISEEALNPPIREMLGCCFVVPKQTLANNPQFDDFRCPNEYLVVTGNAVTSTIAYNPHAEELNVAVFYDEVSGGQHEDDFFSPHSFPGVDIKDFDPNDRMQELFKVAEHCHPTTHKIVDFEEWVGLDSRAVLIGDAAHSSLVHGSYNASMAVEDAFVLGRLFSYAASYKQIPFLLNAYQELRQPRTAYATQAEINGYILLTLPPGEHQNARDAALGVTLLPEKEFVFTDDMLAKQWADYVTLYSFNPQEAVDDWWSKWGRKMQEYL